MLGRPDEFHQFAVSALNWTRRQSKAGETLYIFTFKCQTIGWNVRLIFERGLFFNFVVFLWFFNKYIYFVNFFLWIFFILVVFFCYFFIFVIFFYFCLFLWFFFTFVFSCYFCDFFVIFLWFFCDFSRFFVIFFRLWWNVGSYQVRPKRLWIEHVKSSRLMYNNIEFESNLLILCLKT